MSAEPTRKAAWSIDQSHPALVKPLEEALRQVMDPEIGLNVVELGLVREVVVRHDSAEISMMMTTPFCPYAPAMLEMARQKAEEALQRPTTVEFITEPWDPSMMDDDAAQEWGFF